ncbi:hypothetical protein ACUTQW_16400 [Serratia sp. TSA_7]|uniref:hypothetical protein n=1 Tax=Serratia sp. TSA_7 TaxID=3415659 RepID=UPI004046BD5B
MNVSVTVLSLFSILGGIAPAMAQVPPNPPLVSLEPLPLPPVNTASNGLAAIAEGKVQRLLINPFGEVDGLRLENGIVVAFPPHMGDILAVVASPGQSVRIMGYRETAERVKADSIVNVATGRVLVDQPPAIGNGGVPPHLRANNLQQLEVEGAIETLLTGPRGETNGVILNDGSIVRFPPNGMQIPIKAGMPFAASGLGTRNNYGQSLEAVSVGAHLSALQPLYRGVP